MLFAALLPIPWVLLVLNPGLWPFAFDASALLLIVLIMDAVFAYPRHLVSLSTRAPKAAFVGEPFGIRVTVSRPGRPHRAAFEVAIDTAGDTQATVAPGPFLITKSDLHRDIEIVPTRRGVFRADAAWVRWHGPLGLVELSRRFEAECVTRIFPSVHASRTAAFDFFSRDALLGLKEQRLKGEGSEFECLREYAVGDDVRFVDWKHSARHRKLLLKEHRAERNHPIVLAFDTGHLMLEPIAGLTRLDHSINSGLLLAWLALRSGDLVGTYTFAARPSGFIRPARGLARFRTLQDASAEIAYNTDETNYTLGLTTLYSRLDRRSLIILFTDFVDTVTAELLIENVRRFVGQHLVIFVSIRDTLLGTLVAREPDSLVTMARSALAYDLIKDRSVVLERLQRMGVQCLDVPPSRLTMALLNRYLLIKQRDML